MTNPFHPYPEPKLTIELVPASQWGDNLRSHLTPAKWDYLREACYARAGRVCEVCGGRGPKHPVECHEIWEYDDHKRTQTLTGLIALCPSCHKVKHIGMAAVLGTLPQAMLHLMKVNQWPEDLAGQYITRQFEIHNIRSMWLWAIDLSWLDNLDSYIEEANVVEREKRSERAQALVAALTRKR